MLVLHEHVTAQTIIGSALILTGLLVSMGRSRVNTL
jgi:drug/metabolite transporter (DMT)-like permease